MRDPGLAPERTQLAWQRFALSLAVIGALALRAGLAHHHSTLGFVIAAILGAVAAALQLRGPRLPQQTAIKAAVAATVCAAVAALTLVVAGNAEAAGFHSCPRTKTWLCATLTVPLDRSGGVPGNLHLVAERLRARRGARIAVMGFPGGPGAATLNSRSGWLHDLAPSLGGRDILLFDQRGTGRSDYLDCGVFVGVVPELGITRLASAKSVQRCANALGNKTAFLTTHDTVEDIEAVRKAAGVDKLVLLGVSYGTRTAEAYAAAYPEHVERVVLDSVVPPEGISPYGLETIQAVPRVLQRLCRGGACTGITGDPVADLHALVLRLEAKPLRLRHAINFFGCRFRPALTRSSVLDTLIVGDESPILRAVMPAAIRAALNGDAEPLAVFGPGQDNLRLVLCILHQLGFQRATGLTARLPDDGGDSDAVYVATLCGDGPLPWSSATPVTARRTAAEQALAHTGDDAFAPFDRATALASETLNACKFWPQAGASPPPGALPALPTLVISGEDDLRTPVEDAKAVAARIPGAQFLQVPDQGHSLVGNSGCADRGLGHFMAGEIASPCHDPEVHSPKPLTPLQLRCFVELSEAVTNGTPRKPPHPTRRTLRCARHLSDAFSAP